jgi:hypothetical protein
MELWIFRACAQQSGSSKEWFVLCLLPFAFGSSPFVVILSAAKNGSPSLAVRAMNPSSFEGNAKELLYANSPAE